MMVCFSVSDVTVNGFVVGKEPMHDEVAKMRTYFGKLAILSPSVNITAQADKVEVFAKTEYGDPFQSELLWNNSDISTSEFSLTISNRRYLTVTISRNIVLSVMRHKVRKNHSYKVDYLGLYITEGSGFSFHTKGLIGKTACVRRIYLLSQHTTRRPLGNISQENTDHTLILPLCLFVRFSGQFQHQTASFLEEPKLNTNDTYKAKLLLEGPLGAFHTAKVHLRRRQNMETREHIPCWHAANNATGLIAGVPEDYLVPRLYLKGDFSPSIASGTALNEVT